MIDLLLKRRSIRNFTSQKIELEKIELLIQAALLSPSAKNLLSSEFIIVEDKEMLIKLSGAKPSGGVFLNEAVLAIVIVGNTAKTDAWIEDASIAATNIQMEAESLGLGSCWVHIRNRNFSEYRTSNEYIKELLEIPDNFDVEAVIALGYKVKPSENHTLASLDRSRIHTENF
jgi:nitroreductase